MIHEGVSLKTTHSSTRSSLTCFQTACLSFIDWPDAEDNPISCLADTPPILIKFFKLVLTHTTSTEYSKFPEKNQ